MNEGGNDATPVMSKGEKIGVEGGYRCITLNRERDRIAGFFDKENNTKKFF